LSEKCGNCPDLFAGNYLLIAHTKTCEQMLRHRAVYGDNCGVVWVLRTTWCSRRAAHPKEEYREFALINQRRANCIIHRSISSLKRKCGFMLKSDIKSCPSATDPFFQARCAPAYMQHMPLWHCGFVNLDYCES